MARTDPDQGIAKPGGDIVLHRRHFIRSHKVSCCADWFTDWQGDPESILLMPQPELRPMRCEAVPQIMAAQGCQCVDRWLGCRATGLRTATA
jgi:hypothetical protein